MANQVKQVRAYVFLFVFVFVVGIIGCTKAVIETSSPTVIPPNKPVIGEFMEFSTANPPSSLDNTVWALVKFDSEALVSEIRGKFNMTVRDGKVSASDGCNTIEYFSDGDYMTTEVDCSIFVDDGAEKRQIHISSLYPSMAAKLRDARWYVLTKHNTLELYSDKTEPPMLVYKDGADYLRKYPDMTAP